MLKFAITLIAALFVSTQSFALDVALPPDTTTTLVDKWIASGMSPIAAGAAAGFINGLVVIGTFSRF